MARSSAKVRRLVELFRNLETTERAKVSELTSQIAELRENQEKLLSSLASPTDEVEPFLPLMSRSVGNMDRRIQRLEINRESALQRYVQAAGRTHGAAELLSNVKVEEDLRAEQKELEALLEFQQSVIAQGRCKSSRSI
jgi:hypothetical protein